MLTTTLRSAGGSVVMSIPKRVLELVNLRSGSVVDIDVKDGHLVIGAPKKPRYALAELLAQCDFTQPIIEEHNEWLDAPAQGLEEI
ncbi:MAG: AbrB/MazE/SpoVT family DNA-binding domain-containing protein [Methylophilaceae bacterium]